MNFKQKYSKWVDTVNCSLESYVTEKDTHERNIYKSMRYSLMAGGKRLRPVLCLAVCDMLGGSEAVVLPFACAIEMIHTYSLIHDDLPAMDNDDYRRGKLTNHKVFGEAMAILAGDALLNYAFEIMIDSCRMEVDSPTQPDMLARKIKAMKIIANASGTSGMIGGQVIDIESEGKVLPVETLEYMHKCKTGALIKAPIISSAILCGASDDDMKSLDSFSTKIGLGFQIKDDMLDVEGNSSEMGKLKGSDEASKKVTYVSVVGLEKSRQILANLTEEAVNSLKRFGPRANFLIELAKYLLNRNK